MRALVLDHQLALQREYPDPHPRAGESVVRVRIAGICGTDLELARGYMAYRGVLGHEFVGRVEHSAERNLIGRRVVGEINAGCGKCDRCAGGLSRHCASRTVLGILGRDGAFADLLCLPDENLIAVPDSVPDELAVFSEPVAAAYEIFEQTRIARNQSICVLGDGRLGAIVAMVLRGEDYRPILAGHHPEKLARLSALGISTELATNLESGFDVAIDCTGASAGLARAIELVRPRGTIVLKSTAAAGANLNLAPIVIDEIAVVGSRCGRLAPALAALAQGKLDPRPLISGVYAIEDGLEAMEAAASPPNFKILLKFS
ncbi:MAG: alcohol dehydrogenase catalytic domain-containing protein [Candidatus Binataceae bacterium]